LIGKFNMVGLTRLPFFSLILATPARGSEVAAILLRVKRGDHAKMTAKSAQKRQTRKSNKGSVLVEVLIALAILSLGISAVLLLSSANQDLKVDSQTNNEALAKAQEQLENMRALSRQDINLVQNCDDSSATKCSGALDPFYNRKVIVTDIDSFSKQVTSQVTYSIGSLRPQKVELSTVVADWISVLGGDTCTQTLSGDWANPQLLGTVDVGGDNGGTDVDVLSKKAYVTTNPSGNNKPNFYVVDVANPNIDLPILGSIDTNPSTEAGLATVHAAGKYAYVANMSTVSQLQIIDISVPTSPTVVPSASLKVTAVGDAAVGNSIFYTNKRVYLGLIKSSGPEFYVIDVSDPLNPLAKASFEINSRVNAITVKNNIAYLAVPDDDSTSTISEQLKILDVSQADAGVITQLNTFSPNPATMSGEGLYISKDGKTLYLGQGGANSSNPVFFSLDVTNPNSISPINSKYIGTKVDGKIGITVNAIAVRSNLAFLWTSDTNLGFQIWDLNNLGSPTPYAALNTQQTPTGGLDCDGNLVYTAQRSNKALQIIGPGLINATITLAVHNAAHDPITAANIGDTVHASVMVAGTEGTPAGKVDITFYTSSDNCTSGGISDSSNPFALDNTGVVDPSSNQGPLNAGSYSFQAHYEGDSIYNVGDSACKSLIMAKATPTVSTTIYDNADGQAVTSVPSGTVVYDQATLTGSVGTPTGTVNFTLYKNDSCNLSPGQVIKTDSGVDLISGAAQSSTYKTKNGDKPSISYQAHYNGDFNYNAVDGPCESLIVN